MYTQYYTIILLNHYLFTHSKNLYHLKLHNLVNYSTNIFIRLTFRFTIILLITLCTHKTIKDCYFIKR